jgi:uncharacterized protein with HEPN domain
MKSKKSDFERLYHILESINLIQEFVEGVSYESYKNDLKLKLALVKLFENIGEAANAVSFETQNEFKDIEWHVLRGIRNVLVHEYFGIDFDVIWNTIQQNIPSLKIKITECIEKIKPS